MASAPFTCNTLLFRASLGRQYGGRDGKKTLPWPWRHSCLSHQHEIHKGLFQRDESIRLHSHLLKNILHQTLILIWPNHCSSFTYRCLAHLPYSKLGRISTNGVLSYHLKQGLLWRVCCFLSGLTLKMPILPEWHYIYCQLLFKLSDIHLSNCFIRIIEDTQGIIWNDQIKGITIWTEERGTEEQSWPNKNCSTFQILLAFGPPCTSSLTVLGVGPQGVGPGRKWRMCSLILKIMGKEHSKQNLNMTLWKCKHKHSFKNKTQFNANIIDF